MQLPRRVDLNGIITSPAAWYETKTGNGLKFDMAHAHVRVDRGKGTITLVTDEHYADRGTTVTGKLSPNPALLKFGINRGQRYTTKTLSTLLKMNRIHFPDRDRNMTLVKNIQNFKVRVTEELEQNNDLKGNRLYHFERKVKQEFDFGFILAMPLYKGYKKSTFGVEVLFDVTDGSVSFWLESVELAELEEKLKDEIMDEQVGLLSDFTVIEQ